MIYQVPPPPREGLPGESALLASEVKSLSSETKKKNSKLLKDGPKGSRGGGGGGRAKSRYFTGSYFEVYSKVAQ